MRRSGSNSIIRTRYTFDEGRASTTTDDQGRYELLVPPNQIYLVVVRDEQWASAPQDGFAVFKNEPVDDKDFTLRKATRVFGTLINEQTQKPIPNERLVVLQYGRDLHSLDGIKLSIKLRSRQSVRPAHSFNATTDDQGRFEFALGDGTFEIYAPRRDEAIRFEIAGQAELELSVSTRLPEAATLLGLVFANDGNAPLEGVQVTGVPSEFLGNIWHATTGKDGKFRVQRYRESACVHAVSADQKLAAIYEVGPEKGIVVFQLQPVGSAKGRLLTSDSSRPFAGESISYGYCMRSEDGHARSYQFGGAIVTEADGTFRLKGLVPGWEYALNLRSRGNGETATLKKITIAPGESVALGDLPAP